MTKLISIINLSILSFLGFLNSDKIYSQVILTNNEVQDLSILREEEKLARDVYYYSFQKYQLKIFEKITESEQKHMDKILFLLLKYGISDPTSPNKGEFTDKKLQNLYDKLIIQVDISVTEALKVGATIEDLDIFDIKKFETRTDNPTIKKVYNDLTCGSKNHLRAFIKQLAKNKYKYEPQYISKKYFKQIIRSSNQACQKNNNEKSKKNGKGKGMGKGKGQGRGQGQRKGQNRMTSW